MAGCKQLKRTGKAPEKMELVTLSKYYPSYLDTNITIQKRDNGGFEEVEIQKPRIQYLVFYLNDTKKTELAGIYRYYSDPKDGGFRIGGKKRSVGALSLTK